MREMLYAEWVGIRMPILQMAVRVVAVALFGVLLAGPMMLCMIVVMPAVLVPRMLCDATLSAGWEAYSLTLPAGRHNLVLSQFVLTLCCNAATAAICLIGMLAYQMVTGVTEKIPNDLVLVLACFAWAMAASGLMLAVSYRWGLNRANYMIAGGVGVLYLMIAVIRRIEVLHSKWQVWNNHLIIWLAGREIAAALLASLAGCVMFVLCYLWSVHTYQKKEL